MEYQQLEHGTDHEEAHGGAEHLGDEEKPCARPIGRLSEALLEVAVDRDQIASVEQRHQHIGYQHVAHDEA